MQISVELTMYPFNGDYIPEIKGFIDQLNTYSDITIKTFPTATIVMGDYERVMTVLKDMLQWSYNTQGKAVFVAKFLPGSEVLASEG